MSLQKVNLPKMGTAVQAQSITSLVDDKGDKTDRHVASLRTFIPYGEHVFVELVPLRKLILLMFNITM